MESDVNSWPSCPKDDQLGRRGPWSPSARSSYHWDSPKLGSKAQRGESSTEVKVDKRNSGGGQHQGRNLQGQLQGRPGFKVEGPSMSPAERH